MTKMTVVCYQCGHQSQRTTRHKPRGKHSFCSLTCFSVFKNAETRATLPLADELTDRGVQIQWTRPIFPKESGNDKTTVPVICVCGKQSLLPLRTIKKSTFRGMCHQCVLTNKLHARSGPDASKWNGGRQTTAQGYIWLHELHVPEHERELFRPMFLYLGRAAQYVSEHRLVVARQLGRPLTKDEIVHHKNGVKTDNRLENLEIVTPSQHRQIDLKYYTLWVEACERIKKLEVELSLLKAG